MTAGTRNVAIAAALMCGCAAGAELPLDTDGKWQDDVLYVEADANTYFDTGVKVAPDTHVVACVAFLSWPNYGMAIGGGGSPNVASLVFSSSGSDSGDVWRTNVSGNWDDPGWQKSSIKADTDFHVWNLRSGSQRIDGLPIAETTIAADAPARCNFMLNARAVAFSGATEQTIQTQNTKMRIRSCQIYSGTTLVRDYAAACRNGEYGLVDQIDGSFHAASGGKFGGKRVKAAIPVEYVESKVYNSDSVFVNTGICPTETTRVVADVAFLQNEGTLMGSGGSNVAGVLFGRSWGTAWQWSVSGNYSGTTTGGTQDLSRHTWDLASGSQKVDGVQYGTTAIPAGATPGPAFILFARRLVQNEKVDSFMKAKLWGLKMYDGVALLRDFRPCWWNDRYCLKDRVTGKFFQATGAWGESGNATELSGAPLGLTYKRRPCVASTGSQYIDTRLKPTADMRLWAKMAFAELPAAGANWCMGWGAGSGNLSVLFGVATEGKFGGWYGVNYVSPLRYDRTADTDTHIWEVANGSQKIDGVELATQSVANGKSDLGDNKTLFLFARKRNWELANPDWFAKAKMYGCKIWKGNALVRDYVAAEVGDRACLYDRVNDLPYFSPVGDEFRIGETGMMVIVE